MSRLITATEPEPAQKSLEALTVLHENSSNYEAGYWYFLARAVVCPEESVKAYEEELTDDYWQRFWGFLSYCNTGSPKGGAAVDRLRSVFGQREDDIRLAEAKLERERQTAEQALRRKQAEMSADRSKRMEQEMARLGGAKPAATQQADSKAFAGYETVVPGTKKRNWGKTILIVVVCLIALIGLLFLIPAPESLQ